LILDSCAQGGERGRRERERERERGRERKERGSGVVSKRRSMGRRGEIEREKADNGFSALTLDAE
jgi:hypothetical protein